MTSRTAQCVCGALRMTLEGEPNNVNFCSCDDCQRRSGSVFQTSLVFRVDQITDYTGATSTFTRRSARGSDVTMEFCPVCGVSLLFRISDLAGMVLVHGGCFADPGHPRPTHVWYPEKAPGWVDIPDGKVMTRK